MKRLEVAVAAVFIFILFMVIYDFTFGLIGSTLCLIALVLLVLRITRGEG